MSIMKSSTFLVSLSIVAGSFAAQADGVADRYKAYISGGIGINAVDDGDGNIASSLAGPVPADVNADTGWAGAGAIGLFLPQNWRVELEGAYRDNDVDISNSIEDLSGSIDGWSIMLNAIKDIPTSSSITPYIGAGIGFAERNIDVLGEFGAPLKDDESGFAYQGIIGLTANIGDRIDFYTDYRYFRTNDFDFSDGSSTVSLTGFDDVNHTIMAGLRIAFSPRAAAAAPVMAMPTDYIVYFAHDEDVLTTDAQAVIDQVVSDSNAGSVVRMDLEGHTDTSGTNAYNDGLSSRRVERVKAALVAQGIDANKITVASFGENQPAVATGDGVREPLNRRVTIVVSQ